MSNSPSYIRIADEIKAEWFSVPSASKGKRFPTQEALARRFGVSRSTIVRVLSRLVAEGYVHSQQGSGVFVAEPAPREPGLNGISLIVPDLRAAVILAACRGVERRARQLGLQVLLASSEQKLAHECELVEQHIRAGVKGLVLYPVTRYRHQLADDYLAGLPREVPVVTMDIGCEEWPCSRVHFDNARLGQEMTRLLLRHGHRHIAFMHASPDFLHTSIHDRQRGWELALREEGMSVPESYRGWPQPDFNFDTRLSEENAALARSLMDLSPRPDAVIAWNDEAAAHLIQALVSVGVEVPGEIRVAGFDCEPVISRLFRPQFPTSRPDFARLGELAVDALLQSMQAPTQHPRVYYYPVPVMWREQRSGGISESALLSEPIVTEARPVSVE